MKIAVVLGYWLHDDGSMDNLLIERLDLARQMISDLNPDYVILSGGVANEKAGRSEASAMYDYLKEKNVPTEMLIKEDKSHTTLENAINSCKIAEKMNATTLIICSSIEHFTIYNFNPLKMFNDQLQNKKVKLLIYTEGKKV